MSQLVDRFGRVHTYLRISVTDRCNLRCVYCMPAEGIAWQPREEILSYEEIVQIARVFVQLGVEKIRLTGGEPLVRRELETLVALLADLPSLRILAMTTNAVLLKDKAAQLKENGLQALNISLDTLRPERFALIAKRPHIFSEVMAGLQAAIEVGFDPIKLNMVVMAGVNEDEILDFVALTQEMPLNVRFIEYMPFKDNQWRQATLFPYAKMKQMIETRYKLIPKANEASAVAKDFVIEGFRGSISFITSMTDSFCGTCNRLRLTADGHIKSCLFHPAEINIREALRSGINDNELADVIRGVVLLKPEAHPPMTELVGVDNLAMIQIGG